MSVSPEPTPLSEQLAYLGRQLTAACGCETTITEIMPTGTRYPRPHVSLLKSLNVFGHDELLVFKRYRTGASLEAEVSALERVGLSYVTAPAVLISETSDDTPLHGPFVVMTYVPGRHLDEVAEEDAGPVLAAAATAITQLHATQAVFAVLGPVGRLEQGQDLDLACLPERLAYYLEVAEPFLRQNGRDEAADLAGAVVEAFVASPPAGLEDFPTTLLHGDLHVSNLLVDDTGRVGFVDWAESCHGDAAVDLAYFYIRSLWLCFPEIADGILSDLVERHCVAMSDEAIPARTDFWVRATLLATLRRCAEWDRVDLVDRFVPLLRRMTAT